MNRFSEAEAYWRDRWLCPGCHEIAVVRRGHLCWRCRLWEDERTRSIRGLFWGLVLGSLLWAAIVAAVKLLIGGHHAG